MTLDSSSQKIISKLVQEESGKRQYYRPVYSLHKWWARRSGAQFRSIILLAAGIDSDLFHIDKKGNILESSSYLQTHNLEEFIIFDPFMGGGTTLVEANRLGAKVIGSDINPVSYWIVREALRAVDLDSLNAYFKRLDQTVGNQIRELYKTDCAVCGSKDVDSLYAFWIRVVDCPECRTENPLYKRTLLNKGLQRNRPISDLNPATVFCPTCFNLGLWSGEKSGSCSVCDESFDPGEGTYSKGRFQCMKCGINLRLLEVVGQGQSIRQNIVAIEYWCPSCKKRLYKSPDEKDLGLLETSRKQFEQLRETLVLPEQPIVEGSSSVRWRNHGYDYYYKVFSPRQHLAFNLLINGFDGIPKEFRDSLVTVFSNSLEYNNMMTPYNFPHRKLHHLFTYHALPLTTTPVENVVWGCDDKGAGTFTNCYARYVRAKQYCQHPFDKFKDSDGRVQTVHSDNERIEGQLVNTFEELKEEERGALLFCRDSSTIPEIPDNSVDLVITDPPYFDNVHYSELSNFFYVWLRLLVNDGMFQPETAPTEGEAIVNAGIRKGESRYQQLLTSVFEECHRVLKEKGTFAFTFHHTKWRAWWTILCAVRDSGFLITDSFPIKSEYKVSPHIRRKNALDTDLVVFCKNRKEPLKPLMNPDQLIKKTLARLDIEPTEGPHNDRFLRYMGELLKISTIKETDYSWFTEALQEYESKKE